MEHLHSVRIWLAAAVISIILGSAWQLDGPSDIDVMELVAADKAEAESGKAIQP